MLPIDYVRIREYCSAIIRAVESAIPFRFNGNVPNTGLITNLPPGCNVEVPIFVDNAGLHPPCFPNHGHRMAPGISFAS